MPSDAEGLGDFRATPSLLTDTTRRVPLRAALSGKRITGLALTAEVIWNSLIGWSSRELMW
jgi:hypothetical protein